jgi:competence protein ComEA
VSNLSIRQAAGHLYLLIILISLWAIIGFLPALGNGNNRQLAGSPGQDILVEIRGFVPSEGLYFLPTTSNSADLLKAAGISPAAELRQSGLFYLEHLSSYFYDGKKIAKTGEISNLTKLALGYSIDLNQATSSELALIPQISTKMAETIIDFRKERGEIRSLEELMTIKGIKDKRIELWKKYLHVNYKK